MRGLIPAERIAALLKPSLGIYPNLAFLTGMSDRRLRAIINGEQTFVKFQTVDKILTGMGRPDLWHYSPEDGGFADCYEDVA